MSISFLRNDEGSTWGVVSGFFFTCKGGAVGKECGVGRWGQG